LRFFFAILTVVPSVLAGELAVLHSGHRIAIERHDAEGEEYVLYSAGGGITRLPRSLVSEFEALPDEPKTPAAEVKAPNFQAADKSVAPTRKMIDDAARRHGLPEPFVHSVVAAESAYNERAVSPKGAMGLMQLMPGTAKTYGVDPADPSQNIEGGVAYLRDLLIKYNGDANLALAAYNAGPGAVQKYNGVPPYRETQNYVSKVLNRYLKTKPVQTPE
jgi:soluble lytic murein transglycosylase-like protein